MLNSFKLNYFLGWRNLFRQKKRNIFLGITIALGIFVLTIINSFTNGVTDILLNKILVHLYGNIEISMTVNGKIPISRRIYNKKYFINKINENIKGVKLIYDNVSTLARVVGNKKSGNIFLVGIDINKDFLNEFNQVSGNINNIKDHKYQNPIVITKKWAKRLNVTVGDKVYIKASNIFGQQNSDFSTIAIIVESKNILLNTAAYISLSQLKNILGYSENETGSIKIILENPKNTELYAQKLYDLFEPEYISVDTFLKNKEEKLNLSPINLEKLPNITSKISEKDGILVSQQFLKKHKLSLNDYIDLFYFSNNQKERLNLKIIGIIPKLDYKNILITKQLFFKNYFMFHPDNICPLDSSFIFHYKNALIKEYIKLPRTKNPSQLKKKLTKLSKLKTWQPILDIRTMQENASQILKLESAIDFVSFVAFLLIFFVILIGIINTIRINIFERAQEIGTMYAIGMKQKRIAKIFISEIMLLTLLSISIGVVMSIIVMRILSIFDFSNVDSIYILLNKGHLYFKVNIKEIIINTVIIMIITFIISKISVKSILRKKPIEAINKIE